MNHEQLLAYISKVIDEIVLSVANTDDLLNDKKKAALIQSIMEALDRIGLSITQNMPDIINNSYSEGMSEATAALQEVVTASQQITSALTVVEAGAVAQTSELILKAIESKPTKVQKRIHLEAVSNIVDDSLLDLGAAVRTARNNASVTINDTLEAVKSDLVKGLLVGDTNKVITKRVAESFVKDGLTSFVTKPDKNGKSRKLPLDFYARTVVNTKIRQAHTNGASNRYQEAGVGLVQISTSQNTCAECARYEGKVISLTGEHEGFKSDGDGIVRLPPYHPNCRHNTYPYVLEFKTPEEIQQEKDKWRSFKTDKDTRSKKQKQEYEKEQSIRRKANEEKKQFARYKMALGQDAPKTLGAFRRMKRSNSVKYQELQAEYKRIMREDVIG
ncbi:hypothetical protein BKM15_25905 [Pseudomonas syringae pv. syringae]|nr:hypothetical protein BKM15_25905 [Pseudomonas syringae pv. syringae]